MSRAGRIVLVVVSALFGLALLMWQVRTVGVAAIEGGFAAVGWGFAALLVLSGLRFAARSLAWITLMGGGASWTSALSATISGDAIGNLTPLRLFASEPAKALLLGRGDASRALAALVVENACYSVSVAVMILLGAAVMLSAFALTDAVRWAGWIAIAAMMLILAGLAATARFKPAIASAALARAPFVRLDALVARVRAFEETAYGFVHGHGGRMVIVIAAEVAYHLLSFAETYLTLWWLTGVSSPLSAFVLDSVNRVINVVFLMVPLRLGVAETGTGLVARAIGFSRTTGVSLALVGKGRILAWGAVGLVLMGGRLGRQRAEGKRQP